MLAIAGYGAERVLNRKHPHKEVRGSSTQEFITTTTAPPPPPPPTTTQTTTKSKPPPRKRPKKAIRETPWPTYGYDPERTHAPAAFRERPPYRWLWHVETGYYIEYPPVVAYNRVYVTQQKGRLLAIDATTGKLAWEHRFDHCAAASPTVWRGVVYVSYMQAHPCDRYPRTQPGFLVALDADTGKILWRFWTGVIESSPLMVDATIYFGSWNHRIYALNARTKTVKWTFEADSEVNTSGAYWDNTVYFGTDGGSVYALNAWTGKLEWVRHDGSEYFYATPTVAYGRVYIGNTDGTLFSYGAKTGDLIFAQRAGTYIYTAAAVWNKTVYVGSYDGGFYAFDAATGDLKWRWEAPAAIHGAPTVLAGVVYFSTCEFCGRRASRYAKQGPRGTFALDATTGRLLWQAKPGEYSAIVADAQRVYLVGKTRIYALEPLTEQKKHTQTRTARGRRRNR